MNARQFLNSSLSAAIDRYPRVGATLSAFPKFLYPAFIKSSRYRHIESPIQLAIVIYFVVFFFVFAVQAGIAYTNGVLFLQGTSYTACFNKDVTCLRYFFGDLANLINYVLLVEFYCVSGCFFLIYNSNIDSLLGNTGLYDKLGIVHDDDNVRGGLTSGYAYGGISILFLLVLVLIGSIGYAVEVQGYPPHWYMNFSTLDYQAILPSSIQSNHWYDVGSHVSRLPAYPYPALHYYLLLNFSLLIFVGFVGIAHFGLFQQAKQISERLRRLFYSDFTEDQISWLLDDNELKRLFAPFTVQVLMSKIFVLSIIFNMSSWKMWEPAAGIMNDIAVVGIVIIGVWVVTMPRYYIQFHVFRIRKKMGLDEYKDIRLSWILGGSALVDLVMIAVAGNILFNTESIFEMIGSSLVGN